jgi:hypothetical protein
MKAAATHRADLQERDSGCLPEWSRDQEETFIVPPARCLVRSAGRREVPRCCVLR